jgi:hypothetical protein
VFDASFSGKILILLYQTQTSEYYETTVVGDVTPDEIARAQSQVDETFSVGMALNVLDLSTDLPI